MVLDAGGTQAEQIEQMRRQLESVKEQKLANAEHERILQQEIQALEEASRAASTQQVTKTSASVALSEAAKPEDQRACLPNFAVDRFVQGLAFLPSRIQSRLPCEDILRKYAIVPVTLYCGSDPVSKEVESVLWRLFEGSARVSFQVRHFGPSDNCDMKAVLEEQVALFCFHCQGKEGEADTLYGRALRKQLLAAGRGWSEIAGDVPGAYAVLGYGYKDPFVMLYRNSRGDSGLVSEALEALGSTPLLKHLFVDEDVAEGVPAAARRWAQAVTEKAEDWARGCWQPEVEVLKGPEWSFEEIMRWEFITNRRGMQDG